MDLSTKAVFQGEFPLTAQFRSGPRNPVKSYDQWKGAQFLPEGLPVDLQTNVLRFAPENYKYADRFAEENPSMLMMSTWRAASGNPKGLDAEANGDPLGQSVIDFPGHFVLSPGSYLKSDISASATTFIVTDGDKMVKGPALLVKTNGAGAKIWDQFEYVLIRSVNGNTVTVKRAFNGSPDSISFPGSTTYVAPMPWDFRVHAEYTDWFFNFSEHCPLDSQNRTAMDVVLGSMIGPLRAGGALEHIGGLDLASGPLVLNPVNADYDLDGEVDDDAVYRKGVRNFYKRVWKVLGKDRVLTTELDYEMIGYINGVNQEGLARPNDPWKEVSRTVNDVLAWQKISPLPMVSLAFVQYLNNEEEKKRVQMHRLLNGYATCLGLAADVDSGNGVEALERMELFKGAEKQPHWLGKSTGPLVRPAAMTPNLLLGNGSTSSNDWKGMVPNLQALRADLRIDGKELVITPNGKGDGFVTLYLYFKLPRTTDLTVFLEARSDDNTLVRHIKLPRISVPVETGGVRATITNVTYVPVGYLMRGAEAGSVIFDVRFEEGGDIRVKNLSVHAATDTLACEFEHGVVLVNPSLEDVNLNLTDIFPGRKDYHRLTASNVPRNNIPDKYALQYDQAMELNNGKNIGNPDSVKVLERNALFLIAGSAPASSPAPTSIYDRTRPTSTPTLSPTEDSCKDIEGKFKLKPGADVGCWYVQRFPSKTARRCAEFSHQGPPVSYFCPQSCGICDGNVPSPPATNPPSIRPAPPSVCEDINEGFELYETTFVNCKWTSTFPLKTASRCSVQTYQGPTVSDLCPRSCGKCSCKDTGSSFTLASGASVTCLWTLTFPDKTTKRCSEKTIQGTSVRDLCPSSCGSC